MKVAAGDEGYTVLVRVDCDEAVTVLLLQRILAWRDNRDLPSPKEISRLKNQFRPVKTTLGSKPNLKSPSRDHFFTVLSLEVVIAVIDFCENAIAFTPDL